ncbi:MAG: NYN domain-containing protein [Candidatus Pacebacteria bacterium]|nr:NYN domain-containing protein [Candidatus Paceibacterota bacterium]
MKPKENNIAFVDAQNLYFGTTKCGDCAKSLKKEIQEIKLNDCVCGNGWAINLAKFRIYLKDNYSVSEAYYFLGYLHDENSELYKDIQKAGFIVAFKEHHKLSKSKKKGNVDTDIVFEVMKNLVDNQDFDKIILVSGDGDYKKLVQYLLAKDKFKKILFPNKKYASSLYKELGSEFFDYLENLKTYIQ